MSSPSTRRLGRLVDHAHQMAKAAHQATSMIVALAALPNPDDSFRQIARKAAAEFDRALAEIRGLETDYDLDLDPTITRLIHSAMTRQVHATFDGFRTRLEQALAGQLGDGMTQSEAARELVDFVCTSLTPVLNMTAEVCRLAADLGQKETVALALTDPLTGLPNRRGLHELSGRVDRALAAEEQVTVLHIDLDDFKTLNDTQGHAAGDAALCFAGRVIGSLVRGEDFAARLGGDEFAVIMVGDLQQDVLMERAEKLIEDLSTPFFHKARECKIGASIGLASSKDGSNAETLDALLQNADLALYAAKESGRGRPCFYDPDLRSRADEIDTMSGQIRRALDAGEFIPYFQPQVDGRTGNFVGVEALIRWNHPTRGLLTPRHFLDLASETAMFEALDIAIMELSLKHLRRWINDGLSIPRVSLNLSPQRLGDADLVDRLKWVVEQSGLETGLIGLEILETTMMDSTNSAMIRNATRLSDAGFKIELDDFGTGHAAIANLRHFKVDRIKIDKSFVKDLHLYSDLSKITSAIIGLAHSLRIDVLAEGVETPEERLVLNALGCDHIQGYGIARPMPAEELPLWVADTQAPIQIPPRIYRSAT